MTTTTTESSNGIITAVDWFIYYRSIVPELVGFFAMFIGLMLSFPALGVLSYGIIGIGYDWWHTRFQQSFSADDMPEDWLKSFGKDTPEQIYMMISYWINTRIVAFIMALCIGFLFSTIAPTSWEGHSLFWQVGMIATYPIVVGTREVWVRTYTNIFPKCKNVPITNPWELSSLINPVYKRPYVNGYEISNPSDWGGQQQQDDMYRMLRRYND